MLKALTPRRRRIGVVAAAFLLLGVASACGPTGPSVTTDPALYPVAFQTSVTDYVNRCDPATPTEVTVSAPGGTTISVDGQPAQGGSFTTSVDQAVGERFTIRVTSGSGTTSHHVRCLPTDFPTWDAERTGTTQAQYYATSMIQGFSPGYQVVFDTNGVPIWWTPQKSASFLFEPLPNGHLALELIDGPAPELALDGRVVRTIDTVGGPSDFHDVELLPNGNYAMATAQQQQADLSPWGQSANATVINHVFQVLSPTGDLLWSWDASEHIPVTETTPSWRAEPEPVSGLSDPWHYNSVEWTGDGFLISFRHLDAIYKVDYPSGAISWKLGGIGRPESLTVMGDPVFTAGGTISGQHDARLQADGTVTLFDNGSRPATPRKARAVRYRIDTTARTATLLESVVEPTVGAAPCCGSARRLPGGNWVVGWGGSRTITEQRPDGTRVFRLLSTFVYRAIPIPYGRIAPSAFRAGMDAQYAA
jgi:Arylsulfotransferase (ASST)